MGRALKLQDVSRSGQSEASKAVSWRQSVGWAASEGSLLLMEDGVIKVKVEPEGTHEEGTQGQGIHRRVISRDGIRRPRPQDWRRGKGGRGGEGKLRRIITVGAK